MVLFHDLATQLKSFCSTSGREASRAPAQVIDSEVSLLSSALLQRCSMPALAAKNNPPCC